MDLSVWTLIPLDLEKEAAKVWIDSRPTIIVSILDLVYMQDGCVSDLIMIISSFFMISYTNVSEIS